MWLLIAILAAFLAWWLLLRPRAVPIGMSKAAVGTVREFVVEEGTTRLPTFYPIDMPVGGTLLRVPYDIGTLVSEGQVIARVDPYDLQQQINGVQASIAQVQAQIEGVDVNKPKPEQIDAAKVRVQTASDNLDMARRELDISRISLENARKEYNRIKSISEQGGVSRSQLDEAERRFKSLQQEVARLSIAVDSAKKSRETAQLDLKALIDSIDDNEYMRSAYKAEIENLQSRLAALRNDLAKTDIRSPINGVITEKFTEGGTRMAPGSPVMTLGNLADIEVETDILSEEIPKIQVGTPAELFGKALREGTLPAVVKRIYPQGFKKISALGIEQQRVKVILGFDNSKGWLRPGTRVDVRIITAQHDNTLVIPERALFRQEGQWYVFAVRHGRATLTPVSVGLRNDEVAEILEGLQTGDTVITEPTNNIKAGMRVKAG
jgi:HlyD family secretion protein